MRNIKWNVVNRERLKDLEGQPYYNYSFIKTFWSSHIMPLSSTSPDTPYGFDPQNTYRFFTREDVAANTFVQLQDDIYHIKRVEKYPRHQVCFIEVVK